MHLGLSSFAFGWSVGIPGYEPPVRMNESDLLQFALSNNIHCLQIADNIPLHLVSNERLEHIKDYTFEGGRLELGARKLTPSHLETYVNLAEYFKSPLLRFVIDGDQYEPKINEVIAILKNVLPQLKRQNLYLGIENHDRLKAREFVSIIEACGSDYIGICLDTVNSIGAGEGLDQVVDILGPYTINLHIKDFKVNRLPHMMGFEITGLPAGQGQIEIPDLLEKLTSYGRCQSAVLEQWVPFTTDIDTTVELEKKWAQSGLDYLKRLPYFTQPG
jgi:sugar phosphate isomerase/epimerase